ncbi:MAG: PspC domain-containing protein [Ignavibacteriales bacterium]
MRERLYRSRTDKMLAGVAGGIAEYFDIDPVIVRIIFVVAVLTTGPIGLLAYILFWIVVPYREDVVVSPAGTYQTAQEPVSGEAAPGQETPKAGVHVSNRKPVFGLILIIVGMIFLAERFFPYFEVHHFWPLILVAIGVGLLLKSSKKI